jgi:hypothetical protein
MTNIVGVNFNEKFAWEKKESEFVDHFKNIIWSDLAETERVRKLKEAYKLLIDKKPKEEKKKTPVV